MLKKLAVFTLGATLLIAPGLALAQSTDVQSQISALQTLVQQLLAQLAALQNGGTASSCVNLPNNLIVGSTGSDVTALQNYLIAQGLLSSDSATGYFGPLTEQAVQSWQTSHHIVSSGTPASTGYGAVGPQTRAAIGAACNGSSTSTTTTSSQSHQPIPTNPECPLVALPIGKSCTGPWQEVKDTKGCTASWQCVAR